MESTAFLWGVASAVSLPIGAALGLLWRPGAKISSSFMAFGGGALLFALTIELMAHVPEYVAERGSAALAVAVGGALLGGLVFDVLNQFLNDRGAFLRKLSSAKDHVARTKRARARRWLRRLSRMQVVRELSPEEAAELVKRVRKERYRAGATIFDAGDRAREIHFIRRGRVEIVREKPDGGEEVLGSLGRHETFGELAVLEERDRATTARAAEDVELYTLDKSDLEPLMQRSSTLRNAIEGLARSRSPEAEGEEGEDAFAREADDHLDDLHLPVSEDEIEQESSAARRARGAALAIWLGIGIDAVPESLVIGTLAIGPEGMSLAFIAGVFLANLPESMSSAVSMHRNEMSVTRILLMWTSLCLLTGFGAWAGAVLFPPEPAGTTFFLKLGIEGLAAGAMLTMIAETMLPEAFEQGGRVIGFATLCGFLAALSIAAL